ncbi:hypothetical protein GCM10011512_12720 [Tersicoccus solisilvae]|uniref:Lysozyme n=1 Tax=Tersicoccus solisilvae TaxID=1882339 RepID=A0ABQ1NYP6_9MICC|nr:GH25 family lysozyme [Tersicoccus solisilvae]GGC87255.1 hypothetical protein GCM10011512_12720 [Tersicoccus solisilvae]
MTSHSRDPQVSGGHHLDSSTATARPLRALTRWLTTAIALALVVGPGAGAAVAAPVNPYAPPGSPAAGTPGTAASVPAAPVPTAPVPTRSSSTSSAPGTTLPKQTTPLTAAERASTVRSDIDLAELKKQQGTNGAYLGQGVKARATGSGVRAKSPSGTSTPSTARTTASWTPDGGVLGMDVSGWQQNVNWATAWSQGSKFAYVKASEGNYQVNDYFSQQYNGAAAVGMIRGGYHFALPGVSSGASQATTFINNGGGWSGDGKTLPPLLDVEYNPYPELGNACFDLTPAQMVSWIRDFSNTVKAKTGRAPAIYTTTDWWIKCTGNSAAFSDNPLHLAAYSTWVGDMPASWSTYSIWQFSSEGPFVGDSNQWNGSYAQLQTFARGAVASAAPVAPAPVIQPTGPSITSPADVVAADTAGNLWNYPATGRGTVSTRYRISTGWATARSVTVIDWNNDGVLDLLGQWRSGSLTVYPGKKTGGFGAATYLIRGGGIAGAQLTVGYWIASSAYPQVLARNSNGTMTLWRWSNGGLVQGGSLGAGWTGFDTVMIDFDGDGLEDLLARHPRTGGLYVYRGNGTGGFLNRSAPRYVGGSWNIASSISVLSNFSGAGSMGLAVRVKGGNLRYYAVPGNGTWGSVSTFGTGWNSYNIAGGETIRAW